MFLPMTDTNKVSLWRLLRTWRQHRQAQALYDAEGWAECGCPRCW